MRAKPAVSRPASAVLCLLVSIAVGQSVGCGGGALSQADMMKMSRRRTTNDDGESKTSQPADKPTQTATALAEPEPPAPANDQAASTPVATTSEPEKPAANKAGGSDAKSPTSDAKAELAVDTRQKPATPMSFEQRGQLSISNMERIALALEEYRKAKGKYPPRAIYDRSKRPILSWRVALLPFLGYQELYDAFKLDQPWNSPTNKPLLEKIPAVYQSPERFDSRTNYLLAVGAGTIFPGPRTISMRRIEDGVEHTALVVEVNDAAAAKWTQPQEYTYASGDPKKNLGQLRQGHVFVAWGGGMATAVPLALDDQHFRGMMTPDAGDPFNSYSDSIAVDEEFFAGFTDSDANAVSASAANVPAGAPRGAQSRATRSMASKGLNSEFSEAARLSFSMDEPGNALLWYYAANVTEAGTSRWDREYRWVPALQRPCATIHFCIGVRGPGEEVATRRATTRRTPTRRRGINQERNAIVDQVTIVGEELLRIIEEHAEQLVPASLKTATTTDTRPTRGSGRKTVLARPKVPVSYLPVGSRSELIAEAVARAGDVLVLFEARNSTSNSPRQWVSCDLIDLAGGKKILSIPRITWIRGQTDFESLKREESFKRKRWQLEDALEDSLTLQDWPDGLKPRHAKQRIGKLADARMLNPLAALAEMSVYRNRQLVDTQTLLDGYRGLLGPQDGEALMLGSDKKKQRVLRTWLPAIEPSELQQLALRPTTAKKRRR